MLNVFKKVPKELFRVSNGRTTRLRERSLQHSKSFDVLLEAGKVKAKALDPTNYAAPNGASMRPNGTFQEMLVRKFKGSNTVVYCIPEGTVLPDDLLLVHEHTDHYSLQPAKDMSLEDLNQKITSFLESKGVVRTKQDWLQTYTMSSNQGQSSSQTQWVWDQSHQKYRYWDGESWVWQ